MASRSAARFRGRLPLVLLCALLAGVWARPLVAATARTANGVTITGTDQHVWFLSELPTSGARTCRVHYNHAGSADGRLFTVRTMSAGLVAAAAWDDTLYFVLSLRSGTDDPTLAVRELRVLSTDPAGPHRFTEPAPLPPVPEGCDLLELGADGTGPVLLVSRSDEVAILRLESGAWMDISGAAPWREAGSPSLVTVDGHAALLTHDDSGGAMLWAGEPWAGRSIPWRPGAALLSLGRQLVLVSHTGDGLALRLVWGSELQVRATLPGVPVNAAVITQGDEAAAYWLPEGASANFVSLRRQLIDASGSTGPVEELVVSGPMTPRELETLALIMGSLFLTIVVFILKPERQEDAFNFPEHASLADPLRRLMAFMIDVLPGAAVASLVWGQPMGEVLDLPGLLQGRQEVVPLLTAAAVVILHSGVTESFRGWSLGKLMLGCRVVGRDGRPPRLWVSLARNAVKVLCPPLALFVVMSPGASRPGDFSTRVIVFHEDDDADEGTPG
ncbi:MAG: RDD family protein [Phycisphaerales bacterium]|nr:RDD family protein [Phycisphaerales bacterium]